MVIFSLKINNLKKGLSCLQFEGINLRGRMVTGAGKPTDHISIVIRKYRGNRMTPCCKNLKACPQQTTLSGLHILNISINWRMCVQTCEPMGDILYIYCSKSEEGLYLSPKILKVRREGEQNPPSVQS